MKKLIVLLTVFVLCTLAISGQVWADTDSTSTMVLKENREIYKLNGKDFKFEKPFMKQDTLMSCLDPILKTMNITLEKSNNNKTLTLKYSGSTILMNLDSKDALVDGQKIALPQAPVTVNNSIMVPLRFIAETFGGEVSVDSSTLEIIVTKEIAGDNSIKDFSLILKKTTKEIVGDSYYNWTIRLPKDVKISYRSFNGSHNTFEAVDGSYTLYLSMYDLTDGENVDTLLAAEIGYSNDYTLITHEKSKKNGLDYFKIAYKDNEYIYEERDFIRGKNGYELYLIIEDADLYKNNKELAAFLDSFTAEFKKDGTAEDLSDVTPDGYRIYEDKKLDFSIKVPANWYDSSNDNKENQVIFREPYQGSTSARDDLFIYIYSIKNGLSLDAFNEKELQYYKDEYDPELLKVLESGDININGAKAKKLVTSMKLRSKPTYSYNIYITGENYRYELYYLTDRPYSDAAARKKINYILEGFSFNEPAPEEVESFLDPYSIEKNESIRSIFNKANKFSFEAPASWLNDNLEDTASLSYSNSSKTMNILIQTKKGVTEQAYIALVEDNFKKAASSSSDFIYNSKQVVTEKGTKVTKFDIDYMKDETVSSVQYNILSKNGTTYEVLITIQDINASAKNKKILSDIWKSFKLE